VESNTASDGAYSAGYASGNRPSRSGTSARAAALVREVPLIVLSVLSLGFWGAVVVAVSLLAFVRLW
jgi:hypothetical protein